MPLDSGVDRAWIDSGGGGSGHGNCEHNPWTLPPPTCGLNGKTVHTSTRSLNLRRVGAGGWVVVVGGRGACVWWMVAW